MLYHSLQYLSFIHFCRLTYCTLCPSQIPGKFCTLQISPFVYFHSHLIYQGIFWSDFSSGPRIFLTLTFNLVSSLSQQCLFWRSVLLFFFTLVNDCSLHLHPLISSSRAFVFSQLNPSSFLLFGLSFFFSKVCIPKFYLNICVALFPYFSNLPEIVFFLTRDRLCHASSFSQSLFFAPRGLFAASEYSSVLIFSRLFCFLYLPALLKPYLIHKHSISALHTFGNFSSSIRAFLTLHSSFFPLRLLLVTFRLLSPIAHFWSTYVKYLFVSPFLPVFRPCLISLPFFFLSFVFLWMPATSRLCIYSFLLPLRAALPLPVSSFSFSTTTICHSPTNMYSLNSHL